MADVVPAALGAEPPPGIVWEIDEGGLRSGTRTVTLGGVEVRETVSTTAGLVDQVAWTGSGAAASALRAFRPVSGLTACPPQAGQTLAAGPGALEVRVEGGGAYALSIVSNPTGQCPAPAAAPPPAAAPAAAAPPVDAELPWRSPEPPPAAALARVRWEELPTPEASAARVRHVVGWCVAAVPEGAGAFAFSVSAGGWLPEVHPDLGGRRPDLLACVYGGLQGSVAEGRAAFSIDAPGPGSAVR